MSGTFMPGAAGPLSSRRPVILAVGLGFCLDPEVVASLESSGDVVVGARCVSAEQVEAAAASRQVSAALLSWDLYRLDQATLERLRLPLVLVVPGLERPRWPRRRGLMTVPPEAGAAQVRTALSEALRGKMDESAAVLPAQPRATRAASGRGRGRVVWLTKYAGSHGATMLAANLVVKGGRAALVDLDPGSAAAAYLDADQDHAVQAVVRTAPATPDEWDQVLAAEVQPVVGAAQAGLLAGAWRAEERVDLAPATVGSLLEELRGRYALVLVDLGLAGLFGAEAQLVRVVQEVADRILVVGSTDVVGLWQTRAALQLLGAADDERVSLVLTRYDARRHYALAAISAQLGKEPLAVVPYDYKACARALDQGQPVVLDERSRAGRALAELARRLRADGVASERGVEGAVGREPAWQALAVRLLGWWRGRGGLRMPLPLRQGPTPPVRSSARPPAGPLEGLHVAGAAISASPEYARGVRQGRV